MDIPGPSNSPTKEEGEKVKDETLCTRMDELVTNEVPQTIPAFEDLNGGLEPEAEMDEPLNEPEQEDTTLIENAEQPEVIAEPPKRRRGRPPKNKDVDSPIATVTPKKTPKKSASPQKRPRKYKKKKAIDSDDDDEIYRVIDEEMYGPSRKKKKASPAEPVLEEQAHATQKKRRGRPPKSALLDPDMPITLAPPKVVRKPGRRGGRRSRAVHSSDVSDDDDELERMPTRLTADMLRTIDHFHHVIETLPEKGYPSVTPGLAYLPFSEIYRVYSGRTDPGYEVITFPNDSTIFT